MLAVVGGAGYWAATHPQEARSLWQQVAGKAKPRPPAVESPEPVFENRNWDGKIKLVERQRAGIGLTTTKVLSQTEPIRLELLGTTKYDEDAMTRIRPMFKARVDKVNVTVGNTVHRGEPLVDLYSADLAEAKMTYEIKKIQWSYDQNLLRSREELRKTRAISDQLFLETQNTEMKSRREQEVAKDLLYVYGLNAEDISKIESQSGADKARMTLRSPTEGIVIERNVVPGNLYDENDTLLTIAPLDHLWVWGNVFESDIDMVELGQAWDIQFPLLKQSVQGKVDYISNRVDPVTHAIRVRTSIPNINGRLKSDMLVRGILMIPPKADRVVIPRVSMVVADGHDYVFVRTSESEDLFERRLIKVVEEKEEKVVVSEGLKIGEDIVETGSLILNQIYDDQQILSKGTHLNSTGHD